MVIDASIAKSFGAIARSLRNSHTYGERCSASFQTSHFQLIVPKSRAPVSVLPRPT